MGKVYRVDDKKIKKEVALKLIKPEIASDKKTIEHFSNELKLARKIRHKNVCQMFELMEDNGTHFITKTCQLLYCQQQLSYLQNKSKHQFTLSNFMRK